MDEDFDADQFYKNIIGVTVNGGLQPRKIEIWVDAENAPYILTKPLHHTQRVINENEDGSIIVHLFISPNYEMERLLLGFGCGIEVLRPENLRKRMKETLQKALAKYDL